MDPDLLVRAEVEDGCINTSRRSHDTGRNDNRSSLRNASPYVAPEPRRVGPMRFAGKRESHQLSFGVLSFLGSYLGKKGSHHPKFPFLTWIYQSLRSLEASPLDLAR